MPVELHKVFRQDNKELVDTLAQVRIGNVTPEVLRVLKQCERPLDPNAKIKPTKSVA